jgi:hypothetical protein
MLRSASPSYHEPFRVEATRHDLPTSEATKLQSHEGVTSHNLRQSNNNSSFNSSTVPLFEATSE